MRLAAVALAALLLPGCGEPPVPTSIEVYAEPGAAQNGTAVHTGSDGGRESTGVCGGSAQYQAHIQRNVGTVDVVVRDAAGKTTSMRYTESGADTETLTGAAGTWSLNVTWSGYAGALHVGLLC